MKIEILEFSNLNSLKGVHRIDFTSKPLGDAGLFAVTGPTGSGKTTIFDAVCLGLFGQTPRLSKYGGRDKKTGIWEIVTRGAVEAVCEVRFLAGGVRYLSRWEVHRAHKRLDRDFVDPSMRLSRIDDNGEQQILEEKISAVPPAVEDVCGLSFERFTRSVMLAQGGFDAFLQVQPGERAALLEKLTGTSIYSRLSKEAYRRFSLEQQALESLKLQRQGVNLLSEEERKELETRAESSRELARQMAGEIEKKKKVLADYTQLEDLEKEIAGLKDSEERLREDAARIEQLERLTGRAAAAESCRLVIKDLENAREAVSGENELLTACNNEITKTGEMLHTVRKDEERLGADLKAAEAADEENRKRIEEAKELESEAKSLMEQKKGQEKDLDSAVSRMESFREEEKNLLEAIGSLKERVENYREWCGNTPGGTELLDSWDLVKNRIARRFQAAVEITALEERTGDIQENLDDRKKRLDALERDLERARGEFEQLRGAVAGSHERDAGIFALKEELGRTVALIEKTAEWIQLEQERSALEEEHSRLNESLAKETAEIGELKDSITSPKTVTVLSLILRKQLKKGKACSVCGSTEHPVEKEPEFDFESRDRDAGDVILKFEELTRRESNETVLKEKISHISDTLAVLDERMRTLPPVPGDYRSAGEYLSAFLQPEESRQRKELEELEASASAKEQAAAEAEEKEESIRALEEERSGCRMQIQQFELELKNSARELERLKAESLELENLLSKYGAVAGMSHDDAEELYSQGHGLKESSRAAGEELQGHSETLASLRTSISSVDSQMKGYRERISDIDARIADLFGKRNRITGGVETARFESSSARALELAIKQHREAEKKISSLEGSLASLKQRRIEIESRLGDLHTAAEECNSAALTQVEKAGFSSVDLLRKALMEPDVYEENLKEIRRHNREMEKIGDSLKNLRTKSAALQNKLADADPPSTVAQKVEREEQEREELLTGSGAALEQISRDDEARKSAGSLEKKIAEQERVFTVWNTMRSLIGSSDGTAFQRFAQSVTLDRLIDTANAHLHNLSSRYVLGRRDEEQLSLEITDTWQGGIIRPVTTLSGGETFIVSLSLALGLSSLVSSRLQIETLFLDEGFGTLDSETLETVLSVLETVRSRGKQIGVISHVDALKERIPVKIEVIPVGNGHSRLDITG